MTRILSLFLFAISSILTLSQSVDDVFSAKKMKKDLEVFKEIRLQANSGVYKYRTKQQIDSIYDWSDKQIEQSSTYRDFYNIICQLTDFEGSAHNDTSLPKKYVENLRKETYGYFPYPIQWIDGKWRINFEKGEIPLGAEIISINNQPITEIVSGLFKYETTDGFNVTGKRLGIKTHFAKYFRLNFGLTDSFKVKFRNYNSEEIKTIKSVAYLKYYENFRNRHSMSLDKVYYTHLKENQKYYFKEIDASTGILTIHSFAMGNETDNEHKVFATFLDSIFINIKSKSLLNLIVDVRQNKGGDDPNDLITYSYLTQRDFQENKQAWISFKNIPLIKYYNTKVPRFLRPLVVGKYNKEFQEIFPLEKNHGFYQDENSDDQKIRKPNKNAFTGNVYLLVGPATASAGSLFAAMVSGNENTITIGEETLGGYYGHNGHAPLEYKLPKSKIETDFFAVNLEQDVPEKSNQMCERGIMPDYDIPQSFEDFLNNEDTQLNFTLEMINRK